MTAQEPATQLPEEIVYRLPEQLSPHPLNPRGQFPDDESIEEMKMSIQENGILQPLRITPEGIIVIGHRRYRAGCHAKITDRWKREFPCIIREMSDAEQLATMMVENMQRKDLNPLQEAVGYSRLQETGLNRADVARRCAVSYVRVGQLLDILKLNRELYDLFADYRLPLGAVGPLSRLDSEGQRLVGLRAAQGRWSVKRIEKESDATGPSDNGGRTRRNLHTAETSPANPPLKTLLDSLNAKSKVHLPVSKIIECAVKVDCSCSGASGPASAALCSVCQFAGFLNGILKEAHDAR